MEEMQIVKGPFMQQQVRKKIERTTGLARNLALEQSCHGVALLKVDEALHPSQKRLYSSPITYARLLAASRPIPQ